jgi:hypothetical protein
MGARFKTIDDELNARPWYEKIYDRLYYKLYFLYEFFHYKLPNGIRNIKRWIPVIWGHYDFDNAYLYDVIIFKLELMRDKMKRFSHEVEDSKSIKLRDMTLVINLLKKVRDDYYELEYFEYYDSEISFVPTNKSTSDLTGDNPKKDQWYTMESMCLKDNLEEYLTKHKARVQQVIKANPKFQTINTTEHRHSLAVYVSVANHAKAIKLAFNILSERVEGFWY